MQIFSASKAYYPNPTLQKSHRLKDIFTNALSFQPTMVFPAVSLQNVKHFNMPNRKGLLPSIQSIRALPSGNASLLLATCVLVIASLATSTCPPPLADWLICWARKKNLDNSLEELYSLTTQQISFSIAIKQTWRPWNPSEANTPLKHFWVITASDPNTILLTTIPSLLKNGLLITTINTNFGVCLGVSYWELTVKRQALAKETE